MRGSKKTRYTVDLTDEDRILLQTITDKIGADSYAEAFRRMIRLTIAMIEKNVEEDVRLLR